MKTLSLGGALVYAAIGAAFGVAAAGVAVELNPWFLDDIASYTALVVAPPTLLLGLVGALRGSGRPAIGAAALGLEVIALLLLSHPPKHALTRIRLVVFGIDGATWHVADTLPLPALSNLQARGARAILRSEEPMFSPLLWTTIASGRSVDEHGIHGFYTRSDHCKVARFWDVAWDRDMDVGLYKWLVTWPPPEGGGGFVVPAWLAPEPTTRPASLSFVKEIELANRLKRTRREATRPTWKLVLAGIPQGLRYSTIRDAVVWKLRERLAPPSDAARVLQLNLLRVRIDRDVFIAQIARTDPHVVTFTTYAPDAIGHVLWKDYAEGGPYAGAVPATYLQADAVLAEILGMLPSDAHVLVVSDHGFRATEADDLGRYFAPRTERLRERLEEVAGPLDVARVGKKLTVILAGEGAAERRVRALEALDALRVASSNQPLYVTSEVPDAPLAIGLTLRDEDVDEQRLANDTVDGEPLARWVERTTAFTGEHDIEGILVAAGPLVPASTSIDDARLRDVAPTILAMLGLPAALDMKGRVLFGPDERRVASYDHLVDTAAPLPATEGDINEEQLKALGYIDGP